MITSPPPIDETSQAISNETDFSCDQCGSDLQYNPVGGQLNCGHCGHTEPLRQNNPWQFNVSEIDYQKALNIGSDDPKMVPSHSVSCDSCGASVHFDTQQHAKECPFCAATLLAQAQVQKHLKPAAILPFSLTEKGAYDALKKWQSKLWFAPNELRKLGRQTRKINGIYVPFWTYDAQTRSQYSGERGTVYYVTRTVTNNGKTQTRRVQKIRWAPAFGRVSRFFDDILVLASNALPRSHTDNLAPWPLEELEPYAKDYIAGFRAENYSVGLKDGFDIAQSKMAKVIARDVRFDIGGDRQRIHNIDTNYSQITFKHILLPIWVAAYRYRGKSYQFVINAATGKVSGERPYSWVKIAAAVLLGLAIIAAGSYYYTTLQ